MMPIFSKIFLVFRKNANEKVYGHRSAANVEGLHDDQGWAAPCLGQINAMAIPLHQLMVIAMHKGSQANRKDC
jgi:hypothetical protein